MTQLVNIHYSHYLATRKHTLYDMEHTSETSGFSVSTL